MQLYIEPALKGVKRTWPVASGLFILALILSSCDNGTQERTKCINDLRTYVQNQKDSIDKATDKTWDDLDRRFSEMKAKLEQDTARMNAEQKESYKTILNDWRSFSNEYSARQSEKAKIAQMDTIRRALAIAETRPDFTDLSAPKVLDEYEHFVNTVKANKDVYTKEQWTVVNVSWKALNGRKREVEKDLPSGSNAKIIKLQLEYTGIKAINRPMAENS